MRINRVEELTNKALNSLNINDNIKIEIKPMKQEIASFSFKTKTLRLNKYVVENFDDELLYYIILHELIHFKTNSLYHGINFNEELKNHFSEEQCDEIELKIIQKLIMLKR
jgi:predicted metal-dependent hydrolase